MKRVRVKSARLVAVVAAAIAAVAAVVGIVAAVAAAVAAVDIAIVAKRERIYQPPFPRGDGGFLF
ncbi:MAG: hypothetical protein JWR19_1280 [Pedosphaera sp.]|nr:hypothetical protein [Pedosphaera sp.]